jgi:hypothetical protein
MNNNTRAAFKRLSKKDRRDAAKAPRKSIHAKVARHKSHFGFGQLQMEVK